MEAMSNQGDIRRIATDLPDVIESEEHQRKAVRAARKGAGHTR
jgi:hypothetical protein